MDITHEQVFSVLQTIVLLVLPFVAKRYLDDRKRESLLNVAEAAYWATEGLVLSTKNTVDNKLHEGLARVMEVLGRPLKPKEQTIVAARFAELAGRQKVSQHLGSMNLAARGHRADLALPIAGPDDTQ